MEKINILWADDEIDLLKPHVLFLEEKGYNVETTNNGAEAIDMIKQNHYDIVFLDENMPGLSGLETLSQIKNIKSTLPVIMITKSEEEGIMEDAIGSKISDYLIKPVNPKQILLALKKNLEDLKDSGTPNSQNLLSLSSLFSLSATAERFELYINGIELINGWTELTDWKKQQENFDKEQKERKERGKTPYPADRGFVDALKKGMPECSGCAMGVDRLLMVLGGYETLEDVILFPTKSLIS